MPTDLPKERVRLVSSKRQPPRAQKIEDAKVVICGGRGMGSKKKFKSLFELARLLGGEVGATRPVVYAHWVDEEILVGQAGKHIKSSHKFSSRSGSAEPAIQHTAAIGGVDFTVAVNKDHHATMMKMADIAIVADSHQVCTTLTAELKNRIKR